MDESDETGGSVPCDIYAIGKLFASNAFVPNANRKWRRTAYRARIRGLSLLSEALRLAK